MTGGLVAFGAPGETFGAVGDVFGFTGTPTPTPTPDFPPEIDLLSGSRVDLFTYTIVDPALNVLGELHPVATLDRSVVAPRIRTSIQGNAGRVMSSFVLIAEEAESFDPRTMRVLPSWVDVDGTPYPLGVFRLVDTSVVQFSGGDHIESTLADESAVHHTPTTRAVSWPRGFQVADIITQLAGILNVPLVDADPTTAELGEPLSYPAGSTDWFDVYATVAQTAGMLTPFFTLGGIWRWKTAPDWETVQPDHVFSTDPTAPQDQRRVVQQSLVTNVSLFDAPNYWTAVNNASKGARIVGTYKLPASAPNSYERLGVVLSAAPVELAGLATQEAADRAAQAAAAGALDDVGTAEMASPLDARIELYDAIEVDSFLYRACGWSAQLMPGREQSHDLRRVYRSFDDDGPYFGGIT